jgi:hypothetical protein
MRFGALLLLSFCFLLSASFIPSASAESLDFETEYTGDEVGVRMLNAETLSHDGYMGEMEEFFGRSAGDDLSVDGIAFTFAGLGTVAMKPSDPIKVVKYNGAMVELEAFASDSRVESVMIMVNGVQEGILNERPYKLKVDATQGLMQVIVIPYTNNYATGNVGSFAEASVIIRGAD